jgi:uncharacterized protein (DUF3820 family)
MNTKYSDRLRTLQISRREDILLDGAQRMPFGKYKCERLDDVPISYLVYVRDNMDISLYPGLIKYLDSISTSIAMYKRGGMHA